MVTEGSEGGLAGGTHTLCRAWLAAVWASASAAVVVVS